MAAFVLPSVSGHDQPRRGGKRETKCCVDSAISDTQKAIGGAEDDEVFKQKTSPRSALLGPLQETAHTKRKPPVGSV